MSPSLAPATGLWLRPSKLPHSTLVSLASGSIILIGAWRHHSTRYSPEPFQQEVWIEWLSWVIIYASLKATKAVAPLDQSVPRTQSLWSSQIAIWSTSVVATCSQLLSNCHFPAWILPLITMAVTAATHLSPIPTTAEREQKEEADTLPGFRSVSGNKEPISMFSRLFAPIFLNLICTILFFTYTPTYSPLTADKLFVLTGLLFFVSRSAAIVSISKIRSPYADNEGQPCAPVTAQLLESLAIPALTVLTLILVLVCPDLQMSSVEVFGHALAQSIWWTALIFLVRLQLNNTAANLDTICLSLQIAFTETSFQPAVTGLVIGYLAITQHIAVLRPTHATRKVIYGLFAFFILAIWLKQDPLLDMKTMTSNNGLFDKGHPIEVLIEKNRAWFEKLQERQSETVEQAVVEYERRYGRRPPLGFDKWFELAQENDFVLIDEFDTFMQSLEPFHGIDPAVIEQRMGNLLKSKSEAGRLGVFELINHNATFSGPFGDYTEEISNTSWMDIVPYNVTIAVNGWDEPMVSTPWEEVRKAVLDSKKPRPPPRKLENPNIYPFIESGDQNGWAATSHACSVYSPSRQADCPLRKLDTPINFIENATAALDVCNNCHILQDHGLLIRPGNLRLSHELVPVWSASKPSYFNDILYPSPYYMIVRGDYMPELDSEWAAKDNKFYWVGTATGGAVTIDNWDQMQRQRLVLMTSNTSTTPIQLLEETAPGSGNWAPRHSAMHEIADLFATRISRVVQCTEEACSVQKEAFGIDGDGNTDTHDAAYAHKFLLDIDGNGFSGRYYRLLRSHSVVVKSTILKEWHDDRLIPWVHYVPLSTDYHELPEMARFLATTDRGLELSERIAKESTQWHDRVLRDVDLQLVWLRMVLEYGRVMNPDVTY